MGSNGAGKTTLFNLITGFIKPQSGEVILSGKDITQQQSFKTNQHGIGRTFQNLRLITKLTVKQNVILAMQYNQTDNYINAIMPAFFYNKTNSVMEKAANDIIDQFFLGDVVNSLASEISYGQQKLLSLACCVSNGAILLLLDEAVAGIQPEYRNKIAMLIKQLKTQDKTILLIEHNTDFIAEVADKIFFLDGGIISTFETMETLRNDKQIINAYI